MRPEFIRHRVVWSLKRRRRALLHGGQVRELKLGAVQQLQARLRHAVVELELEPLEHVGGGGDDTSGSRERLEVGASDVQTDASHLAARVVHVVTGGELGPSLLVRGERARRHAKWEKQVFSGDVLPMSS